MSRTRNTADLVSLNAINATGGRVGIGTTARSNQFYVDGNTKIVGVVTASSFVGNLTGSASSLGGVSSSFLLDYNNFTNTPTIPTNNNELTNGAGFITNSVTGDFSVTGNISIGGTLTYDDVSNVDSIGIITARSGINVTGGQLIVGAGFSVHQAGVVTATGFVGPLTGNVTGDVTGNADTATQLATARNIAGVSFDGTSDISLNNNAITNGAGYITTSFTNTSQLNNDAGFITNSVTGDFTLTDTDTGSAAGPELTLYRNSASPAPGDYLGQIMFKGENSNGGEENYAKITGKISDETLGTEDGLIETAIKGDGSFTIVSRQRSDELQLINGVGLSVDGDTTLGTTSATSLTASAAFYMPQYTTTARDAGSFNEGAMIYNTSTKKMEFYDGTNWVVLPGMTLGLTVALDG